MLRSKRLITFSSAEVEINRSIVKKKPYGLHQHGSILLGLIITMVVMAVLGAGMVYLTTTSTFQELFANNNTRAYYAAESGGRYVNAIIRKHLADGNAPGTLETLLIGTYTMSNNEQFQITGWKLYPVAIGAGVTNYFTYDSIGIVGSGFLQAKRKITYKINPANQGTLTAPPPLPPEASEFQVPQGQQAAAWLSQYYDPTAAQDTKIFVQSAGGDAALNLAATDYTMGIKWYTNLLLAQFDAIRHGNGDLLNYGVQIKIWEDENVDYSEIIGISFRLDDYSTEAGYATPENMYGLSFVKMLTKPTKNPSPAWYADYIWSNAAWNVFSATPSRWFVVLWKRVYSDPDGTTGPLPLRWNYMPLAYQKILGSDPVCLAGDANSCTTLKPWTTLMVYIDEISGGNKITGYLASPSDGTNSYIRRTITPNNLATNPILWAEDKDGNLINTSKFHQINWTVVTDSGATPLSNYIIQDSSLTTSNYRNDWIYDTSKIKAREIGLHVFTSNEGANKIFYDNFYIDLTPSGYGYVDGSGQLIQGP